MVHLDVRRKVANLPLTGLPHLGSGISWTYLGRPVMATAATLKEVKRLPMRKPVGKYNVYNKITRSEGTSH